MLGVRVQEYDIGKQQRAVDALLHYADGRIAALEVSSIGPEDEARISNVLARRRENRRAVEGLTRSWIASVPSSFHRQNLRVLDEVILRSDQQGISDLRSAGGQAEKLVRQNVTAFATTDAAAEPPVIWVVQNGLWGFIDRGAGTLPAELDEILAEGKMQKKLAKLAATGLAERHLFLLVRPSAMSFPVYDALSMNRPLPEEEPTLPGGF
ncbi:hypothetical protein [Amycolatopsis sp. NPDC049868]|uniref:hypothetical protein n=1 Tax=Amycolatopsis sp. NPDC049868 TaxID=3363934 RepID=UPI003791777D